MGFDDEKYLQYRGLPTDQDGFVFNLLFSDPSPIIISHQLQKIL